MSVTFSIIISLLFLSRLGFAEFEVNRNDQVSFSDRPNATFYVEDRLGKGSAGAVFSIRHSEANRATEAVKLFNYDLKAGRRFVTGGQVDFANRNVKEITDTLIRQGQLNIPLLQQTGGLVDVKVTEDRGELSSVGYTGYRTELAGRFTIGSMAHLLIPNYNDDDLPRLQLAAIYNVMVTTLRGLFLLHHAPEVARGARAMVHGDVSLGNLFVRSLTSGETRNQDTVIRELASGESIAIIGDFDLAYAPEQPTQRYRKIPPKFVYGTPRYMSTDYLTRELRTKIPQDDVWSLAAALFELIVGKSPVEYVGELNDPSLDEVMKHMTAENLEKFNRSIKERLDFARVQAPNDSHIQSLIQFVETALTSPADTLMSELAKLRGFHGTNSTGVRISLETTYGDPTIQAGNNALCQRALTRAVAETL